MIELIVTGTGRCGTGFAAQWLTSIGIPCGHGSTGFDPLEDTESFLRLEDVADVPV